MFLFHLLGITDQPTMTSLASTAAAALPNPKKYRTYSIKSWHAYQQIVPSHLHSIEHYYTYCEISRKNTQKTLWFSAMKLRALRDGIGRLVGPPRIAQIRMGTSISELGRNIPTESRRFMMTLSEMGWNGME
jgi:hypothetical protein